MKKEKKEGKKWLIIIFIIILVGCILILPQKTITCEKTITKDEVYYERYTVCAGHSFWTGKCNEWKTEYENVQKTRKINVQEPYDKKINWLFGSC